MFFLLFCLNSAETAADADETHTRPSQTTGNYTKVYTYIFFPIIINNQIYQIIIIKTFVLCRGLFFVCNLHQCLKFPPIHMDLYLNQIIRTSGDHFQRVMVLVWRFLFHSASISLTLGHHCQNASV